MSKAERRTFEIDETKRIVYARSGGRCEYTDKDGRRCPAPAAELAHIVPQDALHLRIYGSRLIHHPANMLHTCRRHNSYVEIDMRTRPYDVLRKIEELQRLVAEEGEADDEEGEACG